MSGPFQVNNAVMSRFAMREEEMPDPEVTRSIQDQLLLDGTPALDLAGFAISYIDNTVDDFLLLNLVCSQFLIIIFTVADYGDSQVNSTTLYMRSRVHKDHRRNLVAPLAKMLLVSAHWALAR